MICRKCGKSIPDDSVFCPCCGQEIKVYSEKETLENAQYDDYSYRQKESGIRSSMFWIPGVILIVALAHKESGQSTVNLNAVSHPAATVSEDAARASSSLEMKRCIDLVKSGFLPDYSNKIPLGAAFDHFFENPSRNATAESDSETLVSFRGNVLKLTDNSTISICIMFRVTQNKFQLISWKMNDQEQPINATLEQLLGSVFTNYRG